MIATNKSRSKSREERGDVKEHTETYEQINSGGRRVERNSVPITGKKHNKSKIEHGLGGQGTSNVSFLTLGSHKEKRNGKYKEYLK